MRWRRRASAEFEIAKRYFERAANLDLDFAHGVTAAGGVHIAALGGMWHALVFGFGGMFVGGRRTPVRATRPGRLADAALPGNVARIAAAGCCYWEHVEVTEGQQASEALRRVGRG